MDHAGVVVLVVVLGVLAGCAGGPKGRSGSVFGGRDGPGAHPPAGLAGVPDAEPRVEPIRGNGGTSKPYTVLGRAYVPITDDRPVRESGLASWYGAKFHGQSTASGEPYDMYAMTAAHKTLPLPSYVRVRNPANGREAIVRVNDRGPFHDDRVIDLSYTAALRLDLLRGVGPVEIERITNENIRTGAWRRGGQAAPVYALQAAPSAPATPAASTPVAANAPIDMPAAWLAGVAARPGDMQEPVSMPATAAAPMVIAELPPLQPVSSLPSAPVPTAAPAPASGSSEPLPLPSLAGFWVQLGAFREREGAEGFRNRTARDLPAMASQLRVFSESGTHRLQAGPYATREVALAAVAQAREGLRLDPLLVERP